jgi:hypothetical protein
MIFSAPPPRPLRLCGESGWPLTQGLNRQEVFRLENFSSQILVTPQQQNRSKVLRKRCFFVIGRLAFPYRPRPQGFLKDSSSPLPIL